MSFISEIQSYSQYAPVNEITEKEEKDCQIHNTTVLRALLLIIPAMAKLRIFPLGSSETYGKLPRSDEHSAPTPDKIRAQPQKNLDEVAKAMMEGDKDEH